MYRNIVIVFSVYQPKKYTAHASNFKMVLLYKPLSKALALEAMISPGKKNKKPAFNYTKVRKRFLLHNPCASFKDTLFGTEQVEEKDKKPIEF